MADLKKVVAVLAAVAFTFWLGGQFTQKAQEPGISAQAAADQLQAALVHACETNPLRGALVQVLSQQNQETQRALKDGSLYRYFPDFPKAKLRHQVNVSIYKRQQSVERIQNLDCSQRF